MDAVFTAIGQAVVRRPRVVVAVWLLALAVGLVFAPRLHEVFEREFVQGNAGESQRAADLVAESFTARSAFPQTLVITSRAEPVTSPTARAVVDEVTSAIESTGLVTGIDSVYSTGDARYVSADGQTTYAVLHLRSTTHGDGMNAAGVLIDTVSDLDLPPWLDALITGEEASHADVTDQSRASLQDAETVGLPVALVVLVLVFGALVAAGLPIVVGLFSIAIALGLAFAVGQLMNLSVFLESFVTMMGLGVGIDYSLFLLSRYRQERTAGRSVEAAMVRSVQRAGRAVAFSGLMVIVGLSALLATGEPTVISIGVGGMLVVAVAVLAALTLLPAAVALLGDRIESPRRISAGIRRLHRPGVWAAWARVVMRHPLAFAAMGLVVIGLVAWPTWNLKTGSLGVNMLGPEAQSRQGYERLVAEFGPGAFSPVQIVVQTPDGADQPAVLAAVDDLTQRVAADPRFAGAMSLTTLLPGARLEDYQALYRDGFAGAPADLARAVAQFANIENGGDVTLILAELPGDPSADASRDTVRALRTALIPATTWPDGAQVFVGGSTAFEMDASDALYDRFPVVVGLILAVTFVVLLVQFRSIALPLKAVLLNLASVAGAYGLLVLVFQEGIGDGLLGFEAVGVVNWVTPVLLFAVLFGLSMDYEVFLLSRVRELHDEGSENDAAVATGLAQTGGVITGAAAIMVVVFAAFTLSPIIVIKELGFGLAAAVLLDATLVRMLLVPATMRLLGDANWWLPGAPRRGGTRVPVRPA